MADVTHRNTFKLKSFDTFWLSETPFDISQANDTTNFRICGTAVLSTSEFSLPYCSGILPLTECDPSLKVLEM